ncbi:phosphatase PAP2 family protein [Geobacter argillaceus]|uniref:PAP2 superfamily protein n=1 Tax=Geobacter argillaceus TaxID=345631 RepID=A0A562VH07_9BACT|nr:phosphatase PAP2 family protein [Geobacter argillaceus]TWJ17077.1 PAP2 superfamily protein [Geobacter argillaceus]
MNSFCRIFVFILTFTFSCSAFGADGDGFSISSEIVQGVQRLGDEGKLVVTTPLDFEAGLGWGAVAALGATGLAYVYDTNVRDRLQTTRSDRLDKAADAGSLVGNPFLHLGVAAVVYGGGIVADSLRYKELGEMMGESLILADAATLVLKEATGRARPLTGSGKDNFRPFSFRSNYDSLPSMHTASSFALASVVSATTDSVLTRFAAYGAATFVGFSRLYQNKHWASDVILGAAIGELCGRVVTRYHASRSRSVSIVPLVSGESAGLALIARF